MDGGILWIKSAKSAKGEIGKGMKNGFIIFADPDLSYEEACQLAARENEHKGGVILYLRRYKEKGFLGRTKNKTEFLEIR